VYSNVFEYVPSQYNSQSKTESVIV